MKYTVLLVGPMIQLAAVVAAFAQPASQQVQGPPATAFVPCPDPTPASPAATCKVITLTPLEEQALAGERGILDTAQLGRPLDLTGAVTYFREKIKAAPEGKPSNPQLSSPVAPQISPDGKFPDGSSVVVPVDRTTARPAPEPQAAPTPGAIPRRAPNAPPESSRSEHPTTVVPPK